MTSHDSLNREIFSFPAEHPARRFLDAFSSFRRAYIGFELDQQGQAARDQCWTSELDRKEWRLSQFLYRFLSFDVELDGWVKGTDHYTDSEASLLEHLPAMRLLLNECRVSAQRDRNTVAIDVVEETERILGLWEDCIRSRPIGDRECQ